jgi:hypothetical protein
MKLEEVLLYVLAAVALAVILHHTLCPQSITSHLVG